MVGTSTPTELYRLRPDRMKIIPGAQGTVNAYRVEAPGGAQHWDYAPEEVLHVKYPDPASDYYGLAPLKSATLTVESDKRAAEANRNLMARGFKPEAIVELAGIEGKSPAEIKELERLYQRKYEGTNHGMRFIATGSKFTPWLASARDMEFQALRRMNREEICAVFGVPPPMVGILDRATYANISECQRIFWDVTVRNQAEVVAGAITEHLCPRFGQGIVAEFDFSGVECLQDSDIDEKAHDLEEVINRVRTPNEYRLKWEVGDPLDGGDEFQAVPDPFAGLTVPPDEEALPPKRFYLSLPPAGDAAPFVLASGAKRSGKRGIASLSLTSGASLRLP
jgi:HK97 family phage portal protein